MMCNIIVAAIFLLNYGYVESGTNPLTIHGGEDTKIKEHNFMVSIYAKGHRCAGSILTAKLVITAAPCVYAIPIRNIHVRVGSSCLRPRSKYEKALLVFIHGVYDTEIKIIDFSLLLLKQKLYFNNEIGAIALPTKEEFEFTVGTTINALRFGKEKLQEANLEIVESTECRNVKFEAWFCARNINKILREDDEGGPVFYNKKFIGIVSLTNYESKTGLCVIVPVPYYLAYIQTFTKYYK